MHVVTSMASRLGGPPKAAGELCHELVRAGHEVTIYTTNLDAIGHLDVVVNQATHNGDGVERWYFATQRSGLYGVSMSLVSALRHNVQNFDVVHIHSLYRFTSTVA